MSSKSSKVVKQIGGAARKSSNSYGYSRSKNGPITKTSNSAAAMAGGPRGTAAKTAKKASMKMGGSKKMDTGGAPNANGYGKKGVNYPLTGAKADNIVSAARAKATPAKIVAKPVRKKKASTKKTNFTYDEMLAIAQSKGPEALKKFYAEVKNPKSITRRDKNEPIAMVSNEVVRIPTPDSDIRTAMVPTLKKGGAMKKMKKMSYRKGGSKKAC